MTSTPTAGTAGFTSNALTCRIITVMLSCTVSSPAKAVARERSEESVVSWADRRMASRSIVFLRSLGPAPPISPRCLSSAGCPVTAKHVLEARSSRQGPLRCAFRGASLLLRQRSHSQLTHHAANGGCPRCGCGKKDGHLRLLLRKGVKRCGGRVHTSCWPQDCLEDECRKGSHADHYRLLPLRVRGSCPRAD